MLRTVHCLCHRKPRNLNGSNNNTNNNEKKDYNNKIVNLVSSFDGNKTTTAHAAAATSLSSSSALPSSDVGIHNNLNRTTTTTIKTNNKIYKAKHTYAGVSCRCRSTKLGLNRRKLFTSNAGNFIRQQPSTNFGLRSTSQL